jgi:probable rRNA maturation factor
MRILKINIVNSFNDSDYSGTIEKVLTKASNILDTKDKGITIILVDNAEIEEMNSLYRQKEYATDVLTFPDGYLNNLGDVFISIEKCSEQAQEFGHSFERELGFLVVHGYLHTLGYDHQTQEDEETMTKLQENILNKAKLHR